MSYIHDYSMLSAINALLYGDVCTSKRHKEGIAKYHCLVLYKPSLVVYTNKPEAMHVL